MTASNDRIVGYDDIPPDRRRGGEIRVVLSPKSVGSESGFMGATRLAPGERIAEHYHPYSEEFLFVVEGELTVDVDDEPKVIGVRQGILIPKYARHRLRNTGDVDVFAVFHLCPLAPRPELGHVDTETADEQVST